MITTPALNPIQHKHFPFLWAKLKKKTKKRSQHTVGPVSNEVPESAIAAQPEAQNPNNTEALQKLVEHFAFRYRHIGQRKK